MQTGKLGALSCWRAADICVCNPAAACSLMIRTKGLNSEELLVYQVIKSAGNTGERVAAVMLCVACHTPLCVVRLGATPNRSVTWILCSAHTHAPRITPRCHTFKVCGPRT
jgi:hypothetical protein